ncbi:MAG: hypothetical protein JO104_08670 [Candidatus Eremiobacteraeota bacterium]|nr:hypothetical protein [Candidatus Eremiobacteraeota bacterium]
MGSSQAPGAPSGEGLSRVPRRRRWALAIAALVFAIMCGMIAWSQWYAIHVNVPFYRAQHGARSR